jgi:hypothetical protein
MSTVFNSFLDDAVSWIAQMPYKYRRVSVIYFSINFVTSPGENNNPCPLLLLALNDVPVRGDDENRVVLFR